MIMININIHFESCIYEYNETLEIHAKNKISYNPVCIWQPPACYKATFGTISNSRYVETFVY